MKKSKLLYILGIFLILLSCEPIEERELMGEIAPISSIQVEASGITTGSNRIILKNNTLQYNIVWDYIIDKSTKQTDTIDLPFLGNQDIIAHAFTDGGMVDVPISVDITSIDYPLDEQWNLLAGSDVEGKTWVWAGDNPYATTSILGFPEPAVWGLGGGSTATLPDGALFALGTTSIQYVVPQYFMVSGDAVGKMKFDLNGAANYTYTDMSDPENPVVKNGSFVLKLKDPSFADYNSNPSQVTLVGAPIILKTVAGAMAGQAGTPADPVTFDIVKLTENELHLRSSGPGVSLVWLLKREGYSY
ncbi:hypothetical protein [Draconibacterium halophilum]|uniref:Uncharacterized protein n=1 Tax=Draconibacterium halophilum TaxID=2706887 RepID=A0A6C0REL4_9BACT|nr:hypothetical protein [Draconibacterium halophilum]QIA09148.1 hypothetical protein G0Q07_16120 [Draconibacterium halophilum]